MPFYTLTLRFSNSCQGKCYCSCILCRGSTTHCNPSSFRSGPPQRSTGRASVTGSSGRTQYHTECGNQSHPEECEVVWISSKAYVNLTVIEFDFGEGVQFLSRCPSCLWKSEADKNSIHHIYELSLHVVKLEHISGPKGPGNGHFWVKVVVTAESAIG